MRCPPFNSLWTLSSQEHEAQGSAPQDGPNFRCQPQAQAPCSDPPAAEPRCSLGSGNLLERLAEPRKPVCWLVPGVSHRWEEGQSSAGGSVGEGPCRGLCPCGSGRGTARGPIVVRPPRSSDPALRVGVEAQACGTKPSAAGDGTRPPAALPAGRWVGLGPKVPTLGSR